jgi:hypothetical protein
MQCADSKKQKLPLWGYFKLLAVFSYFLVLIFSTRPLGNVIVRFLVDFVVWPTPPSGLLSPCPLGVPVLVISV